MDLIGDDQRIRALFSELRFADETIAPSFTATWQRAQSRHSRPQRAFNLSFVTAATALLILGLVTLAIWSKYSRPGTPVFAYATVPAGAGFPPGLIIERIKKQKSLAEGEDGSNNAAPPKARRHKFAAASRATEMADAGKLFKDAKTIESWQSPTASLLSSPSDDIFKSLPQLNENANGMKSFLPGRANDKEK